MTDPLLLIFLFVLFFFALFALAGASTQNYCRCIREPRADDDDDLYPELYSECKDQKPRRVEDNNDDDT